MPLGQDARALGSLRARERMGRLAGRDRQWVVHAPVGSHGSAGADATVRAMKSPSSWRPARRRVGRLALTVAVVAIAGYGAYLRSEAHRNGNRLFYRDGRPNRLGRAVGRLWARVAAVGVGPSYLVSLETTGHRSGVPRAIPVVLADHAGDRFVVSMFGERSPWVRNVRAAGGRAVIAHGRRRQVRLVELPAAERGPVIRAFLGRALDARPHIPVDPDAPAEAFDAIAPGYPVFRIEEPG